MALVIVNKINGQMVDKGSGGSINASTTSNTYYSDKMCDNPAYSEIKRPLKRVDV